MKKKKIVSAKQCRDAEYMAHWQTLVENKDERAMKIINSSFFKQLVVIVDKHLAKPK